MKPPPRGARDGFAGRDADRGGRADRDGASGRASKDRGLVTERFQRERDFHDRWAGRERPFPDPVSYNEAPTSPELRYIHKRLAPVKGKSVLDLGCGFGEASVYFALCGARVTAVDLSPKMLEAASSLAERHDTTITTHLSAVEDLDLEVQDKFDVIYAGNLFHHADVNAVLDRILPLLDRDGTLVCWDPLVYNPLIRIYRLMATKVHTRDEHPLTRKDVRDIRARFHRSETRFYWLASLMIFVIMAFQLKNPNKIRYWKAVVHDARKWGRLYGMLEKIDRVLLKILPASKWLFWNVVVVAERPKSNV